LHQRRVRESMVGLISLNLFALASFFVEYFRGDEMIILFGLRFTQMLQLLVFIFSLALIHLNSTRERY
ncbi:MAG: hypothetical protein Q8P95_05210, partial [bacterium]|nr:hypothetical protein [bacterium]